MQLKLQNNKKDKLNFKKLLQGKKLIIWIMLNMQLNNMNFIFGKT